jgi:hypothetical protein
MLVVLALLGCGPFARAQDRRAEGRILVVPFENVTRDGRIFWLTEASAVLLADDLNALDAHAITRQERRAAFDRLQVPPAAVFWLREAVRRRPADADAHFVLGAALEATGSATRTSWPDFTSSADGGCSSRTAIATRPRNSGARCTCRRTSRRRT